MAVKWYRLDAYGSSREHLVGWKNPIKFTDLKDVTVFQIPFRSSREDFAQAMKLLGERFGPEKCIVIADDVKLFRLEEVSEEEVIAEELMKP